ncbi:MAG TPA: peptidylprolyl isomerase [Lacipirellulaceae bacterium]|jgi:cyclophilin family peptidyl-prolyl cis-trans isomerase|nr:peptidylprolyl isomerase [Lacipirellulaceae bacterium]
MPGIVLRQHDNRIAKLVCLLTFTFGSSLASNALATVVRFNTVSGSVDVRLYNAATPLSVANFLNYVTSGRYANTFIHRDVQGFVLQGGGYTYTPPSSVAHIAEFAPVNNEFGISNLRGTIAMAKLGSDPNSATSEWFFNLADNSSNLDNQNGGFTVFGRVVGTGMTVVDAIAGLNVYDLDGASASTFDDVPIRDGATDLSSGLVFINSVQVLNYPAGDYDFNGVVNAKDYVVWRDSLGSTTNAAADGNGDGIVNAADYSIWRSSFGQTGGPGSGAGSLFETSVPEPTSALLVFTGSLSLIVRRRRA